MTPSQETVRELAAKLANCPYFTGGCVWREAAEWLIARGVQVGAASEPTLREAAEALGWNTAVLNPFETVEAFVLFFQERLAAEREAVGAASEAPPDWIDEVIQAVAELPDRTSPDDWPDAMLVTGDELRDILADRGVRPPSDSPTGERCSDCGARMVWSDPDANTPAWMCPRCVHERMVRAEARFSSDSPTLRDALEQALAALAPFAFEAGKYQYAPSRTFTPTECATARAAYDALRAALSPSPPGEETT